MSDPKEHIREMEERLEEIEEEIKVAEVAAEKILPKHPAETFADGGPPQPHRDEDADSEE